MKKELYFVRHGETLFNLQHRIQGACDSPLTEKGIQQAKQAGQYFIDHKIVFDHAYASTQERACDTLECMTTQPYTRLKGLKEWNFGNMEGESEEKNPPIDPKRNSYGDYFLSCGGESDLQLQQRVVTTLQEVMKQEDHHRVLAVSHAGSIFMFLKKWASDEVVKSIKFSNCCILKFEFDGEKFSFVEMMNHDVVV